MSKKATAIYNQQNRVIHRALNDLGMPYREYKKELFSVYAEIIGRKANGLTDLTLGERDLLIRHYQSKGLRLFKPFLDRRLKDWRKGDPEKALSRPGRPLAVPKAKKRLIGKIGAILADMKLSWEYADGISKQMFNIRVVEWCSPIQLHKVVAALVIKQRRHHA